MTPFISAKAGQLAEKPFHTSQKKWEFEAINLLQVYVGMFLRDTLLEARGHYITPDLQEGGVHTHCPFGATARRAETHRSSEAGTRARSADRSPAAKAARCARRSP